MEPTELEPEYSIYQDSWEFDLLQGFTLPSPVKRTWTAHQQKEREEYIYSPCPSDAYNWRFNPKKMEEQTWPSERNNAPTGEVRGELHPSDVALHEVQRGQVHHQGTCH
jgi:hypothetical protein